MKRLFPFYQITVSSSDKKKVLNDILISSVPIENSKINENKELILTVKSKYIGRFKQILSENGSDAKIVKNNGYIEIFSGLKGRLGLLIGFIFLLFALYFSSKIIWKIDISGNTNISDEEIINELAKSGLTLGTYIPNIDYATLHNKVLLSCDKLSWISVNITGNIASVVVKENVNIKPEKEPQYSNVIASSDGYIAEIKVINGEKVVSVGDVVKKGDILISGVIDSQSEGIRYEHASGEIYAYVNKTIKIEIPYESVKKVYTGKKYTEKSYKLYNFPIKFSSKYRNQSILYDKIIKKESLSLLGISDLPIEVISTTYYEYIEEPIVLSTQEAVDKAFVELRNSIDVILKNAELVSKKVETSYDENGFYIQCQLYCIENIAKEQEFYVTQ